MNWSNADEHILTVPRFKSIVVVGRPGTYGWSRTTPCLRDLMMQAF